MTNEYKVPHVYTALAEVVKAIAVEKTGTLPSNLGGKKYAPAPAVSQAVKELFAEKNLLLLTNETVVSNENLVVKDRLSIHIVVTGTYTITSLKDGSSVTVSGTGDGLATATAVAANIASTNAQKNALLRTLLISEQSVEDASHTEQKPSATDQKLDKARANTASKPTPKPNSGQSAQSAIRAWMGSDPERRKQVQDVDARFKKEGHSGNTLHEMIATELGV